MNDFLKYNPQDASPQYLEDMATAYWFSETLFTAVELGIFDILDPDGCDAGRLAQTLRCDERGMERFMDALCSLGLTGRHGANYFNTALSKQYLIKTSRMYQGNSILWRKALKNPWQGLKKTIESGGRVETGHLSDPKERIKDYISAMDDVAKYKAREILALFEGMDIRGEILDVGAGSGAIAAAFLKRFPEMTATFMDMEDALSYSQTLIDKKLNDRINYCPANALEEWPFKKKFDVIILSNIIHAFSEKEMPHLIKSAAGCVKDNGFIVMHDLFFEHFPQKAALFDLNMMINTYNGRVFSKNDIETELSGLDIFSADIIPLDTDTAVIIASKDKGMLEELNIDLKKRLASRIKELGFNNAFHISVDSIRIPDWADMRCRFGCDSYGSPHCPPNSPTPDKTRQMIKDYSHALLLEGEPPTRDFQRMVLKAEKEAFGMGFHKAFSFWAGPCSLCETCVDKGQCRNTRDARPSMESAGIDVFETAKRAGLDLRTLNSKNDFVKYFALLLLE
jgi:predicted metal-binding protein